MDTAEQEVLPSPPSMIKSLLAGFDAISTQAGLVVFGVVVDLLLWFGPHLHVGKLVDAFLAQIEALPEFQSEEIAPLMDANRQVLQVVGEQFNLLTALRTLPVGIASLMAGRSPLETPLGQAPSWQAPSASTAILLWLGLSLAGLVIGALYFSAVGQAALLGRVHWRQVVSRWPFHALQSVLLAVFCLSLLVLFSFPFLCLLSLLQAGGVGLSSFMLLLYGSVLAWFMLPLVFSPHGIFIHGLRVWPAVRASIRLVRLTLPATGMFLLSVMVISEGLDVLWNIPGAASWLSLVSIAAHAFVTTALLAASFVYYRDAQQWVEGMLRQAAQARLIKS